MLKKFISKKLSTSDLHPDPSDRERNEILGFVMKYVHYLKIEGDYFEFGVFEGNNLCRALYYTHSAALPNMHFHAFDSFNGLPEFKAEDNGFNPFQPKEYTATKTTFLDNLKKQNFDFDRLTIHEGWYEDSLPKIKSAKKITGKVAVAWIDCDLYSSTKQALDFLTDYLSDGAILVFDDWFCFKGYPHLGEEGACNAWLQENPHIKLVPFRRFGWHGMSFIVQIA
jgi:O-methyltransferase